MIRHVTFGYLICMISSCLQYLRCNIFCSSGGGALGFSGEARPPLAPLGYGPG